MEKEEKVKEVPFIGKKKMYKLDGDGNIIDHAFRGFNWLTWKNMTKGERAMWIEASEMARAPIPRETIEFEKKVKAANKPKPKVLSSEGYPITLTEDKYIVEPKPTFRLSEIDGVRTELKKRGIKFAYNSKLETLQKKLADADNPE